MNRKKTLIAITALFVIGACADDTGPTGVESEPEETYIWAGDEARAMILSRFTGERVTLADVKRMGQDEADRLLHEYRYDGDPEYRQFIDARTEKIMSVAADDGDRCLGDPAIQSPWTAVLINNPFIGRRVEIWGESGHSSEGEVRHIISNTILVKNMDTQEIIHGDARTRYLPSPCRTHPLPNPQTFMVVAKNHPDFDRLCIEGTGTHYTWNDEEPEDTDAQESNHPLNCEPLGGSGEPGTIIPW